MVRVNGRRLDIARSSFTLKTNRFRDYLELQPNLYEQLEKFGVKVEEFFLLDWFPDGVDVYTVKLLSLMANLCRSRYHQVM